MSKVNQNSYDKIVKEFADSRSQSKTPEEVIQFRNFYKKGDLILDIGCGAGIPIAKYLSEKGLEITGIDISSELLEQARKNLPQGKFIQADIMEYQPSEIFDGIVAWDSLFHLQPNEHEKAFKKIHKLLKESGYFLFTHGGSPGEITGEMHGQQFYYSSPGPAKIKKILEELGFKILNWKSDKKDNGYLIVLVRK